MQVRKSYEEKRSRRRARGQKRPWRLKRMAMEVEDDNAASAPGRGREQRGGPGGTRNEQDMERFMQAGTLADLCCFTCSVAAPAWPPATCRSIACGQGARRGMLCIYRCRGGLQISFCDVLNVCGHTDFYR